MRNLPRPTRRGLALGAVAGIGAVLVRWRTRKEQPMGDGPEDRARRRQAIGLLRFAFVPFEAGAPCVDWMTPFGSADALADLAPLAGDHARPLYAAAMNALPAFVAATAPRLAPGRYRLAAADVAQLHTMSDYIHGMSPPPPKDFGVAADGSFDYTAEYAAILPRLRWTRDRFEDAPMRPDEVASSRNEDTGETVWPVVYGNFKRAYGDMTNPALDLADALGIKVGADAEGRAQLPPEIEARLQALHRTTPAALRVLVLHGDG